LTSDRFFIREDQIRFPHVILDGDEHHHLARVARVNEGDTVWLFDGSGRGHKARVLEVKPEKTRLYILESLEAAAPARRITLAFAVLKARAMDWLLQKATELGAAALVPVITARTVVRLPAAEESSHKLERWSRIVREAAKQSGRSHIPTLSPPVTLARFLERDHPRISLFLFEHAEREIRDLFLSGFFVSDEEGDRNPEDDALVLLGPEGGWTKAEAMDILERGFEAISLGDNVLRAETAALSTLAVLNQFWK
jgi:16S rRNA (uracil1498-N3)-methyltransferase